MGVDGLLAEPDAELARKCYPSGPKNEATAMCICGGVEIVLKTDAPAVSAFCHCWACRRTHSAPLYQCLYVNSANIDPETGEKLEGQFEITITKGFDLLKPVKPGPGYPNLRSMEDNPIMGGLGRMFCRDCGVVMLNAVFQKPNTAMNPTDEDVPFVCVFPATFTEKMSEFIESWQPKAHLNCDSSILPATMIKDGLPKFREWGN
jgi:hypothetical protein